MATPQHGPARYAAARVALVAELLVYPEVRSLGQKAFGTWAESKKFSEFSEGCVKADESGQDFFPPIFRGNGKEGLIQ